MTLPEALFHGSGRTFETVLPARVHGKGMSTSGLPRRPGQVAEYSTKAAKQRFDKAFATPREETAWEYADRGAVQGGRSRVYNVQAPEGMKVSKGNYNLTRFHPEVIGERFDVVGRTDIRPPSEGTHYQGTLPHVDWREHADTDRAAAAPRDPRLVQENTEAQQRGEASPEHSFAQFNAAARALSLSNERRLNHPTMWETSQEGRQPPQAVSSSQFQGPNPNQGRLF